VRSFSVSRPQESTFLFPDPVFPAVSELAERGDFQAADMNGDGAVDVIVTESQEEEGNSIQILFNTGDGRLLPPLTAFEEGSDDPIFLATGDLDVDGDVDAVVKIGTGTGSVFSLLNDKSVY